MPKYASETNVSCESSRGEIERILSRYGADEFMYGTSREKAVLGFKASGRMVKFQLPLPSMDDFKSFKTEGRRGYWKDRSPEQQRNAWEQACRQRWRALALVIKAKLEAVECGITLFEEEFLAHIVLPDGKTVGEHSLPMIAKAYETNTMPALLPYFGGKS